MLPALLTAAAPAFAQTPQDVSDEVADNLGAAARANLGNALTLDAKLAPETEEERLKPLVSRDLERRTIAIGMLSANLHRCGVNWTRVSFLPFTHAVRSTGRFDQRQLTYLAVLHGFAYRMMDTIRVDAADECAPAKLAEMRASAATLATDIP